MRRGSSFLLLAAAAALGFGGGVGHMNTAAQALGQKAVLRAEQPRRNKRGGIFTGWGGELAASMRRARPGWSNRHVQRMARKRRNVKRHRAANRG